MAKYPEVLGESETLDRIIAGESIARYGDGEFKLCRGAAAKSQRSHPVLRQRLKEILKDSGDCMVGIPNIRSDTPKAAFWGTQAYNADLLFDRPYVSSFITRPDSAPWIDTEDYWTRLESLWVGQDITLVRGSGKSLIPDDFVGAKTVTEILAPRQHAFYDPETLVMTYDVLMERIGTPKRAILCLGASATVMAVDLCAKGVHAIDAGHIGMFLRKHRRGERMWVEDADKVAV